MFSESVINIRLYRPMCVAYKYDLIVLFIKTYKMRVLLFVAALAGLTLFSTCKNNDDDGQMMPENPIEGCCDNAPLIEEFGPANMYVPNMFTPNNDGVNDVFLPFTNDGVDRIESFTVADSEGNMVHEAVAFQPNTFQFAWDGKVGDEVVQGLYTYTIVVKDVDGGIHFFNGQVCSYTCGQGLWPENGSTDCNFGLQHDGEGGFAPSVISGESGCDEE
jgi:hypothetical protein